jgi:hypothetical protein
VQSIVKNSLTDGDFLVILSNKTGLALTAAPSRDSSAPSASPLRYSSSSSSSTLGTISSINISTCTYFNMYTACVHKTTILCMQPTLTPLLTSRHTHSYACSTILHQIIFGSDRLLASPLLRPTIINNLLLIRSIFLIQSLMSSRPGLSNDFGAIAGSIVGIVAFILILVILRHCYFPSPSLSPLNSPSAPASSPSTAALHGRISSFFQLRRRSDIKNRGETGAALSERRLKSARPSAATRLGRFVASASNRVHSQPSGNSPINGSNESSETVVHRFSFRDNPHRSHYNTGFHFISSRRSQRIGAEERLV